MSRTRVIRKERYGHYHMKVIQKRTEHPKVVMWWDGDRRNPIAYSTMNVGMAFRVFEFISDEVRERYGDAYPSLKDSVPDELREKINWSEP